MNREQFSLLAKPKPGRIHVGEFRRGENTIKDGLLLLGSGPNNEEIRYELRNYFVVQIVKTATGEQLIDVFPADLQVARPATVFFPEHCDAPFVQYLYDRNVYVPFREFKD